MELKDFVRETLLEITAAVREANDVRKKTGMAKENSFNMLPGGDKENGSGIHFDLAVTTKSGTATGGKAGVNISVVEMGTSGQSHEAKERVSRISFIVRLNNYVG